MILSVQACPALLRSLIRAGWTTARTAETETTCTKTIYVADACLSPQTISLRSAIRCRRSHLQCQDECERGVVRWADEHGWERSHRAHDVDDGHGPDLGRPNSPLRPRSPKQYLCIRYSERLAEDEIVASVGSRGDSFYNAMAEAFNTLYKWELIYPQGPWTGLDDVEFATLGYIDWFNHRRLHGEITHDNSYVTPAEFEATYYRQTAPAMAGITR